MAGTLRWIGFSLIGLTLTGCVSQDQYAALKMERNQLADSLISAQNDASKSKATADALRAQLESQNGAGQTGAALVANLQTQLQTLSTENAELTRRYNEALAHVGSGPALTPQLTNELNTFAQQNPDLVDFDSARGIVKFKSDVTFNVGDATVQAKAKDVIDRFAKILTSSAASGYELQVAGHTDNVPVNNPNTKAAGHKDNWYLSVHRAIAVANELIKTGVNPGRLGVVGYADQHPVASNANEAGKALNRRVEVLILPSSVHIAPQNVAATPKGDSAKPAGRKINGNKDGATVSAPIAPTLNK